MSVTRISSHIYDALSSIYKEGRSIQDSDHIKAYCIARMPATIAVLRTIFTSIRHLSVTSICDIGSGPGSTYWGYEGIFFPERVTFIEKHPLMCRIGKNSVPETIVWHNSDILTFPHMKSHDVFVASYALSELATPLPILQSMWENTRKALIIVEPGTPHHFSQLLSYREYIIKNGGYIMAPCAHNSPCPLESRSQWCHFSQKVMRKKEHKVLKKGSLPFEYEKYSYIIATRDPLRSVKPRIISPPQKRKGHIHFSLCTNKGLATRTVSSPSKHIKKLFWGDTFPHID